MDPMRRSAQRLSEEACRTILERGGACVLALAGGPATDGYPYAVPVNYVYVAPSDADAPVPAPSGSGSRDGRRAGRHGHLLIHGSARGAKLGAIARDARVSACVIDSDELVPEELTTYFRSVIAFGTATVIGPDDAPACRRALELLAGKYAPRVHAGKVAAEIDRLLARTVIVDVAIDAMTGKEAIELVRMRRSRPSPS